MSKMKRTTIKLVITTHAYSIELFKFSFKVVMSWQRKVQVNLCTILLSIVHCRRLFSKCHQQCICLKSRLWCIQKKCLRRTVLCEPEAQDSQDDWLYGPAQHRHYLPLSATLFEVPPAMHLPKVEPMVFLEEVLAPHPELCEPEAQDSPDEFVYGRARHHHHRRCLRLFEMPPAMHLPKVDALVHSEEVLQPHPVLWEPERRVPMNLCPVLLTIGIILR